MAQIIISNVSKAFSNNATGEPLLSVFDKLSLTIRDGELVAIFGPNGCGKTTLLNLIAGIFQPDIGNILINGKIPTEARIGYVFQNYYDSMLIWRTVFGNIAFALELQGLEREAIVEKVSTLLKRFGLFHVKDKYLYELSGGLKQMTAILRAVAYNPEVLCMDEPFSGLDYQNTRNMWLEILKIWHEAKKTTIFVSHDVDEAVFLADRVIVFSKAPARIVGIVSITLTRPRKLEIMHSEDFFNLRNVVLDLFEKALV